MGLKLDSDNQLLTNFSMSDEAHLKAANEGADGIRELGWNGSKRIPIFL